MSVLIVHDPFSARVTPPNPAGLVQLVFNDLNDDGTDAGTRHMYMFDKDQVLMLADEIKKKALNIQAVSADKMPEPPEGA